MGFIRQYAGNGEYWLTLIVNVLGIIFAFILFFNPLTTMFTLSCFIGFYLILAGVDMIVFAFGHFKNEDYFML